jgi:hypothetical protein
MARTALMIVFLIVLSAPSVAAQTAPRPGGIL